MNPMRGVLDEEIHEFPEHERAPVAGSPATPNHGPAIRLAYALVALLVGTTAGMGSALVNVNTPQLQQLFGLSANQVAWLSTSYVMTAVSANLLLIKVRQQYGLRRFTLIFLGLYAALALVHLLVLDLGTTLLLRAISGFVAVALIPLCLFHMMQAFPAEWRLRGLVLGIGVTQCATPLARVLSPSLLASEGWRSLFMLEAGLALLSMAAVGLLRLPPAVRVSVFKPLDLLIFVLMGGGLALIAAVLGLGRWEGWFQAPWILVSLFVAIPALVAAATIETYRKTPLLNLRWLGRGDVPRFAAAIFMVRIVLAEQDLAIATVKSLGATNHQLWTLSLAMFSGAVAGVLASAVSVNAEKLARPMMLAIGIVAIAALIDSAATGPHHLQRFYLSQAAIAFAGTFFLGPALLLGIASALQHGNRELISFIVLFGVVNALGALAGPALLGSHADWTVATTGETQGAQMGTLRLAAGIAAFTTIYLALLLAIRIRRRLKELRALDLAGPALQRGETYASATQSIDSGWRPPRPGNAPAAVFVTIAIVGVALLVAAWGLPVL
ncbi:MFS transporter [Stappia sp. WLB 29]|uniref:MFS transporter n=1 Tax=Stappia sp. WLB 29 TaxID=2925220 RepID=UPI0020BEF060|nr:MFS transporter [Stappia sp. WLB 29]